MGFLLTIKNKNKDVKYCYSLSNKLAPSTVEDKESYYKLDINKVVLGFKTVDELKKNGVLMLPYTLFSTARRAWAYWFAYKLSYPEQTNGWYPSVDEF